MTEHEIPGVIPGIQTVDKLGAGHNPQHQVCLQPEIPAFISWYFFIVKDSEIKR